MKKEKENTKMIKKRKRNCGKVEESKKFSNGYTYLNFKEIDKEWK